MGRELPDIRSYRHAPMRSIRYPSAAGPLSPYLLVPMLLGMDWMDPNWLLAEFGEELFWLSLLIIFVECGLFFPLLPGDTLLFAG